MSQKSLTFVSPFVYPLLSLRGTGVSGGAERQFVLFARALRGRHWNVSFIASKVYNCAHADSTIFPVYFAHFAHLGGSSLYLPTDWLSLWRAMAKADADYYVLKTPDHLLAPMSMFCRMNKRRLVFWSQMTSDADPVKAVEGRAAVRVARLLRNWGLKKADSIIAQSEDQLDGFKKNYGIRAHLVRSICDRLVPVGGGDSKGEDAAVDVLWVGNSLKRKRQEVVLELARLMPERSFAIAIGKSDATRFHAARRASRKLPNVRFLGSVPSVKMELWYRKARIVLNTSLKEGFPNTFLQAWHEAVPVVSVSIDPDNLIERFEIGRTLRRAAADQCDENPQEIASLLQPVLTELFANSALRKKLGQNARTYVHHYHSRDVVVSQLLEALE